MAQARRAMRNEHSSGGAVLSFRDGVPYVALIATRGRLRWGLPKGAVSEGETTEQAALREVLEETGLEAGVGKAPDHIGKLLCACGEAIRHTRGIFIFDFYFLAIVAPVI